MTMHHRPHVALLLIDTRELSAWLRAAKAGEVLEYHRGVLAVDRLLTGGRLASRERHELDAVADILRQLANTGDGYLLQRRHGDGDYTYLFVCSRPVTHDWAMANGAETRS